MLNTAYFSLTKLSDNGDSSVWGDAVLFRSSETFFIDELCLITEERFGAQILCEDSLTCMRTCRLNRNCSTCFSFAYSVKRINMCNENTSMKIFIFNLQNY